MQHFLARYVVSRYDAGIESHSPRIFDSSCSYGGARRRFGMNQSASRTILVRRGFRLRVTRAWRVPIILVLACVVAGLGKGGSVVRVQADDRPAEDIVREILSVGWRSSPAANREIDRLFAAATASGDWRVEYAYALAKMRQWRYREVLPIAERLAEHPDSELVARQLLVWILTVVKDYPAALVQMERMTAGLPSAGEDLAPREAEARKLLRAEKARFLGRVYGYLSGPRAGSLTDFERESRRRRIIRLLTDEEVGLFDDEMMRVIDQYHVRTDERAELVDRELREAEKQRADRLAEIAEFRGGIAEQLDILADEERRAQREHDEKSARIRGEDAPLRERLVTADGEMVGISRNLAILNVDILRIEDQLAFEQDPVIRAALLVELSRLSALAAGYSRELARLEITSARIRSQRLDLANQLRQSEAGLRRVLNQSRVQQEQLSKEMQRRDAEERRLLRERPRTSGQARALQTTKQAFSTYLPFPADDEKQRLLDALVPR